MTAEAHPPAIDVASRQRVMAILADAEVEDLLAALDPIPLAHEAVDLRRPEAGLVMLRGRMGGNGDAFNLGEASVARASVRLPGGEVGHAYVLGRDTGKARLAAIADALWQVPDMRARIERDIVEPVAARLAAAATVKAAETLATRVDFFTLVRGDD